MKELFLALVVLFLVCITCLCRAADTLVICNEGTVSCEIVVPDEAGPVAAFAGKELKELLSQSLSADIPVVKIPSGKKTAIILGNNQFLKNAGIDINKLPRDGFIMKSSGNNIFIAGIDSMKNDPERGLKYGVQLYEQATLFGIYDFLERFVGVRFYFPGKIGTVIPKHKTLKLQAVDIFEKPDFTVRNLSIYSGMIPDSDEVWPESARKNFPFEFGSASTPFKSLCYYRLRLQTNLIPSTHGLARLDYISRFGKTHPEYFALKENGERYILPFGFLCFSSDIKDEIYKDAEAFLTGKPASSRNIKRWDPSGCQPGYFSLMPQDGFYCCNCPECQKYFSKGPKATSEFIWNFVCDIAEKLKKNNIPGYITILRVPSS